jgi:hypothetical protein
VHSLAAALFLPVSKIHWFGDVGYRHNPWTHCPQDDLSHFSGRCLCDRNDNFDENVPYPYGLANHRIILAYRSGGKLLGNEGIPKQSSENYL